MTREKQIIEEAERIIAEANERGNNNPMLDLAITLSFSLGARWADAHPDIDVRTMAAWSGGYKEAIEKACEWLENDFEELTRLHLDDVVIDKFRKAMKGGEE